MQLVEIHTYPGRLCDCAGTLPLKVPPSPALEVDILRAFVIDSRRYLGLIKERTDNGKRKRELMAFWLQRCRIYTRKRHIQAYLLDHRSALLRSSICHRFSLATCESVVILKTPKHGDIHVTSILVIDRRHKLEKHGKSSYIDVQELQNPKH